MENQYFREKICMTWENIIKKTFLIPEKICILPNFKEENLYFAKFQGRKSVFCQILRVKNLYMSGRSASIAHNTRQ